MLPTLPQRIVMAAGIALGLLCLLSVQSLLLPADGSEGISLLDARAGVAGAIALAGAAVLPALALGAVIWASGSPLAAVFVFGASLACLAVAGGPIDGWLWRTRLPQAYFGLIGETVLWMGLLVGAAAFMRFVGVALRPWVKWIAPPSVPALAPVVPASEPTGGSAQPAPAESSQAREPATGAQVALHTLGAAVICALVGGAVSGLLLPNGSVGQVMGALGTGFTIGGLVGHLVLPRANALGLLLSPGLVAIAAYALAGSRFNTPAQFMAAWYGQQLPGVALVLPVFYASAAVAAVAAGIGIAQGIDASRLRIPDA